MTTDDIRFPTLGNAIAGRLTTGAVKGLLALIIVWICTWFLSVNSSFSKLAVALFVSYVVAEVASAAIERPIVVKEFRANPGGLAYVLLPFTASALITFVATFAVTRAFDATILITAIVVVINAAEIIWLRSWKPGPSPEEEHAKFNEFKRMTGERFADDVAEIKRRASEKSRERYYRKNSGEGKKGSNDDGFE